MLCRFYWYKKEFGITKLIATQLFLFQLLLGICVADAEFSSSSPKHASVQATHLTLWFGWCADTLRSLLQSLQAEGWKTRQFDKRRGAQSSALLRSSHLPIPPTCCLRPPNPSIQDGTNRMEACRATPQAATPPKRRGAAGSHARRKRPGRRTHRGKTCQPSPSSHTGRKTRALRAPGARWRAPSRRPQRRRRPQVRRATPSRRQRRRRRTTGCSDQRSCCIAAGLVEAEKQC